MGAKIGYYRCSTVDQNPDRQKKILRDRGCEKIFSDMQSGKDMNRPGLKAMLEYIREGDTLYVESISRLARSTRDLLTITDQLQEKHVNFVSEKEQIDTSNPTGKFMMTVFAAMSELERENILQRQKEGIAIAKEKGKYKGRQPIHYDHLLFVELYNSWKAGEITQKGMAKHLHVSISTLYRIIKRYEAEKGISNA